MDQAALESTLTELGAYLAEKLGDKLASQTVAVRELTLVAKRESILDVIGFLHDDSNCRFVSITDVCGVDYPGRAERFDVVYHLLSPYRNVRVRVKVSTDDVTPVPSITGIFPGADWYEREAYDLYGILFTGHPDLRR